MSDNNMLLISQEELAELKARPADKQIEELKQMRYEKILRRNRLEQMIYKFVPITGAITIGIIIAIVVEILI